MRARKVLITGAIYISYLLLGSVVFQLLESRSKEDRCERKSLSQKPSSDLYVRIFVIILTVEIGHFVPLFMTCVNQSATNNNDKHDQPT